MLDPNKSHWNYSDPAQRLEIAERAQEMVRALADWTPEGGVEFAPLSNAAGDLETALVRMRGR